MVRQADPARLKPVGFGQAVRVNHTPGIVTIADVNTTIAYCRYSEAGEIEYIFVHPAFRRNGIAQDVLAQVEAQVQCRLRFQPPISPLGQALLASYRAARGCSKAC